MPQLEFTDKCDRTHIANVPFSSSDPIPAAGDLVDVFEVAQDGLCAYVKVSHRQFYYDRQGVLNKIQFCCDRTPLGERPKRRP
jgi:hypothetical protein